jgi:hypothetical protein
MFRAVRRCAAETCQPTDLIYSARAAGLPRRGGMAEWLKALAWKACIRETVSWVRIPLPPPYSPVRCTTTGYGENVRTQLRPTFSARFCPLKSPITAGFARKPGLGSRRRRDQDRALDRRSVFANHRRITPVRFSCPISRPLSGSSRRAAAPARGRAAPGPGSSGRRHEHSKGFPAAMRVYSRLVPIIQSAAGRES